MFARETGCADSDRDRGQGSGYKREGRAVELALAGGDCRVQKKLGEGRIRCSWFVIRGSYECEQLKSNRQRTISTIDCYYRDDCLGL